MADESRVLETVRRYFEFVGADIERAEEIYHDGAVLEFAGHWLSQRGLPEPSRALSELQAARVSHLAFDARQVAAWDSGLVTFVLKVLGEILLFTVVVNAVESIDRHGGSRREGRLRSDACGSAR